MVVVDIRHMFTQSKRNIKRFPEKFCDRQLPGQRALRGFHTGGLPGRGEAGKSRLRPVLSTTMTTVLGMIPMALSKGDGSEMWVPLGWSVIGGLIVSTLMTLVLMPVLYSLAQKWLVPEEQRDINIDKYDNRHNNSYNDNYNGAFTK